MKNLNKLKNAELIPEYQAILGYTSEEMEFPSIFEIVSIQRNIIEIENILASNISIYFENYDSN